MIIKELNICIAEYIRKNFDIEVIIDKGLTSTTANVTILTDDFSTRRMGKTMFLMFNTTKDYITITVTDYMEIQLL